MPAAEAIQEACDRVDAACEEIEAAFREAGSEYVFPRAGVECILREARRKAELMDEALLPVQEDMGG